MSDHEESRIINTEGVRIADDPSQGKAYVLRTLTAVLLPNQKYSKKEILEGKKKGIEEFLRKDGLELAAEPKIEMITKFKYKIYIFAKPKLGHTLLEKPMNLKQVLNPTAPL